MSTKSGQVQEADSEIDLAWANEAERRYQDLRSGSVSGVSAADALAKARARLDEPR